MTKPARLGEGAQQPAYNIVRAVGDGECAFNAFILGLKEIALSGKLDNVADENYKHFLFAFNKITTKPATWQAFKEFLKTTASIELQKKLAYSLFRQFAILLIENKVGYTAKNHYASTLPLLKEALHTYAIMKLKHERMTFRNENDIFVMEFIKDKFENLIESKISRDEEHRYYTLTKKNPLSQEEQLEINHLIKSFDSIITELQNNDLTSWWELSGHSDFLIWMKQKAKWAGDLELAPLAEYFNVNLVVKRMNIMHEMHFNYGRLNASELGLTQDCINRMVSLNLIDNVEVENGVYRWLNIASANDLKSCLSDVPEMETILDHFNNAPQKAFTGTKIETTFTEILKTKLILKELIAQNAAGDFVFCISPALTINASVTLTETEQNILKTAINRHLDKVQDSVIPPLEMASIAILKDRGIIKAQGDKVIFVLPEEKTKERMKKVVDEETKNNIISSWERNHRNPETIVLQNLYGTHWDLLQNSAEQRIDANNDLYKELNSNAKLQIKFDELFAKQLQALFDKHPEEVEAELLKQAFNTAFKQYSLFKKLTPNAVGEPKYTNVRRYSI
ncbi:MAG: hypothetical protein P4M12_12975 [Gammaproteobacteria bacterium]|nr:hypothetical protein [Gammaproteobacteria bacterium]